MYSSESFEAFLRGCLEQGHTQIKLVPRIDPNDEVAFYAVGQGGSNSGETFDAVSADETVYRVADVPVPVEPEAVEEVAEAAPVGEPESGGMTF